MKKLKRWMSISMVRVEYEDIEKKVVIFYIFDGVLVIVRNLIFYKKVFLGYMVDL